MQGPGYDGCKDQWYWWWKALGRTQEGAQTRDVPLDICPAPTLYLLTTQPCWRCRGCKGNVLTATDSELPSPPKLVRTVYSLWVERKRRWQWSSGSSRSLDTVGHCRLRMVHSHQTMYCVVDVTLDSATWQFTLLVIIWATFKPDKYK